MPSFLVISPHEVSECVRVLKDLLSMGYLRHFDWGCKDGEHTGWAIIEAENKTQALLSVPPIVRMHAHAVQLNKFSDDQVAAMRAMHEKK